MRFSETLKSRGKRAVAASPRLAGPVLAGPLLAGLVLAGLLGLAACTPDPDEQAPQCPVAVFPPDAMTLTRYDGHGTDLTNLVLTGRLLNIQGACKGLLGHKKLTARTHVDMELTRGPAAHGRDVDVPYNIAIMRNGQLLQKQQLVQHVTFPPNVDTVRVTGEDVNLAFPTDRGLTGPNYTIYFLFELTPEELAANQQALKQQR
jgi:hypothetical protein